MTTDRVQVCTDLTKDLTAQFEAAAAAGGESNLFQVELDESYYLRLNKDGLSEEVIAKVHQLDAAFANSLQAAFGEAVCNVADHKRDLLTSNNTFHVAATVGGKNFSVSMNTSDQYGPVMSLVELAVVENPVINHLDDYRQENLEVLNRLYNEAVKAENS